MYLLLLALAGCLLAADEMIDIRPLLSAAKSGQTVTGNANMGLSVASGKGTVAFNNLATDTVLAVNVDETARELTLDDNLYLGVSIGKSPKRDGPRATLNDWRYVSGLDAHSVGLPVSFADATHANYAVTNALDWSPDRTVCAGWGIAKLAGKLAPRQDIAGVDMSDCKVELFEAKLPIDKDTYAGREEALWALKPGSQFWVGFLIDNNDQPGADTMNFIQWPLGYGYWMPKENGAKAVLD